jgi:hypothetical protein
MLNETLCVVTIKPAGDGEFIAEDTETDCTGYGQSYPSALVALAGEMGKVGGMCLEIMEDWARDEIERMGEKVPTTIEGQVRTDAELLLELQRTVHFISTYSVADDDYRLMVQVKKLLGLPTGEAEEKEFRNRILNATEDELIARYGAERIARAAKQGKAVVKKAMAAAGRIDTTEDGPMPLDDTMVHLRTLREALDFPQPFDCKKSLEAITAALVYLNEWKELTT